GHRTQPDSGFDRSCVAQVACLNPISFSLSISMIAFSTFHSLDCVTLRFCLLLLDRSLQFGLTESWNTACATLHPGRRGGGQLLNAWYMALTALSVRVSVLSLSHFKIFGLCPAWLAECSGE